MSVVHDTDIFSKCPSCGGNCNPPRPLPAPQKFSKSILCLIKKFFRGTIILYKKILDFLRRKLKIFTQSNYIFFTKIAALFLSTGLIFFDEIDVVFIKFLMYFYLKMGDVFLFF